MESLYHSMAEGHHPLESLTLAEFSAIPDKEANAMFDNDNVEGLIFKAKVLGLRNEYRRNIDKMRTARRSPIHIAQSVSQFLLTIFPCITPTTPSNSSNVVVPNSVTRCQSSSKQKFEFVESPLLATTICDREQKKNK